MNRQNEKHENTCSPKRAYEVSNNELTGQKASGEVEEISVKKRNGSRKMSDYLSYSYFSRERLDQEMNDLCRKRFADPEGRDSFNDQCPGYIPNKHELMTLARYYHHERIVLDDILMNHGEGSRENRAYYHASVRLGMIGEQLGEEVMRQIETEVYGWQRLSFFIPAARTTDAFKILDKYGVCETVHSGTTEVFTVYTFESIVSSADACKALEVQIPEMMIEPFLL